MDIERFVAYAREHLGDYPDETDEDVLGMALDVIAAVSGQAKRRNQPLMMVARGVDCDCDTIGRMAR